MALQPYIGRFAPSPTGPLHIGSLYTALAGYLQARSHNGKWLLRIDDLDTPRNVPGATNQILTTLADFGLHWDGEIRYQSQHIPAYDAALKFLHDNQQLYACICSRKKIADFYAKRSGKRIYPGFCRETQNRPDFPHAIRIKTSSTPVSFKDFLQGTVSLQLNSECGDFVVKRRDHIIAYQLASVVDDKAQKISEVVRGYDLLESTGRQIFLQQQLQYPSPDYLHVPVITDHQDCKLSKQSFARPVDESPPGKMLYTLLRMLRQSPPEALQQESPEAILRWAVQHWSPTSLTNIHAIRQCID